MSMEIVQEIMGMTPDEVVEKIESGEMKEEDVKWKEIQEQVAKEKAEKAKASRDRIDAVFKEALGDEIFALGDDGLSTPLATQVAILKTLKGILLAIEDLGSSIIFNKNDGE